MNLIWMHSRSAKRGVETEANKEKGFSSTKCYL
jgi:hypothetical protein